jgi:predicted dehydrogenase
MREVNFRPGFVSKGVWKGSLVRQSVGVVGSGYWGRNLVRVLLGDVNLDVTVIDERERALDEMKVLYPGIRVARSLAEVADRLDIVAIATPPASHEVLVRTALLADCHVFVEKPFTTRLDHALQLSELARSRGLVLMVGHTYDYHPVVRDLAERVQRGDLGVLRYLDSARLAVGGYRTDVDVIWDMAPHDLVIMRRIVGSWPSVVTAWGSSHAGLGPSDIGLLRLEFPNSAVIGYVRVSWLDPERVRRFTAVGDERMAVFNELSDPPLRLIDTQAEPRLGAGSTHPLPAGYRDELVSYPAVASAEPLSTEMAHLLHCVATGETPRSDATEGSAAVAVLEAADRSRLSGRPEAVESVALVGVVA